MKFKIRKDQLSILKKRLFNVVNDYFDEGTRGLLSTDNTRRKEVEDNLSEIISLMLK